MDFTFTEEQRELRRTVRSFLTSHSPGTETWSQLVNQLGLTGLAVPERFGGAGASFVEVAVVLDEMGRCLYPAPYLPTVTAAAALAAATEPDLAGELLAAIAAKGAVATLAVAEERARWDPGNLTTTARETAGGLVIDGVKDFVLDGDDAEIILVAAGLGGDAALLAVAGDAPGLTRRRHPTLDQTRAQARLTFDSVPARLVSSGPQATAHAISVVQVALAVESAGAAARCLDLTVDYLKTRVQFGRALGTFQALRHRCADLAVAVEAATATAYYAAWAAAQAPDELPVVAPLAKAYCSEAFLRVAAETIQLHGGIGFTWEHDAHRYFKRATTTALLFGSARELR